MGGGGFIRVCKLMRGGWWWGFPSRFSFVVIYFAVILVVKSNLLPFLISGEEGGKY